MNSEKREKRKVPTGVGAVVKARTTEAHAVQFRPGSWWTPYGTMRNSFIQEVLDDGGEILNEGVTL